MPRAEVTDFARQVVSVLRNTLIHQRPRWAQLVQHRRNVENWWTPEFATAIENWTWSDETPGDVWVKTNPKPRDVGLMPKSDRHAADLCVTLASEYKGERRWNEPRARIWIELKERGTWWSGGPSKAFGTANHGLLTDIGDKWKRAKWTNRDVVLAGQIVTHQGTEDEWLPESWQEYLEDPWFVERLFDTEPVANPFSVGWPLYAGGQDDSDETPASPRPVLWATLYVFEIWTP